MTRDTDTFDMTLTAIELKKIGSMFLFARGYFEETYSLFESMLGNLGMFFDFMKNLILSCNTLHKTHFYYSDNF